MLSYTAKVIAVLGRTVRAGRWKLSDESLVIAIFGSCKLDLSRAYVDEDEEELVMRIFTLFGSVSIVLPAGCDVEPSGIAILAVSEVEIPSDKAEDITTDVLAPLDVGWFALFGKVRIAEFTPEPIPEPELVIAEQLDAAPITETDPMVATTSAEPAQAAARPEETASPDTAGSSPNGGDAEAEAAALRAEIAQWREESGRPAQQHDEEAIAAEVVAEEADSDESGSTTSEDPTGEAESMEAESVDAEPVEAAAS